MTSDWYAQISNNAALMATLFLIAAALWVMALTRLKRPMDKTNKKR